MIGLTSIFHSPADGRPVQLPYTPMVVTAMMVAAVTAAAAAGATLAAAVAK